MLDNIVVVFNEQGRRIPVEYIPIPRNQSEFRHSWVRTLEGRGGTIDGRQTVRATWKEKLLFKKRGI
jgi:hypothetical protein